MKQSYGIYLTIPLSRKGSRSLIRLLAANFGPTRMQQNSNLHTMLNCEFTVFIYRGGDSLVDIQ